MTTGAAARDNADHLRSMGVDADARTQGEAADELIASLSDTLLRRHSDLIDRVDPSTWQQLLNRCPKDVRGDVLKDIGLPAVRGRVTERLVTDVTTRLQRGLQRGAPGARHAAHELTRHVRSRILRHSRTRTPWPDDDPIDAAGRAIAVALCPDCTPLFLPIALTWMRACDQGAFALLLPDHDQEQALQRFWTTLGLSLDTALERMIEDDSADPRADDPNHEHDAEAGRGLDNRLPGAAECEPDADVDTNGVDGDEIDEHAAGPVTAASSSVSEPAVPADSTTGTVDGSSATSPVGRAIPMPDTTNAEAAVDPGASVALARIAVRTAVDSCTQTLHRLSLGQAPTATALADLTAARTALLEIAAALGSRLQRDLEPTLGAIEGAVEELTRTDSIREQLRALLAAQVPARAHDALQAAVSQARELLDSWPPLTEQDITAARMLSGVVALARDTAAGQDDDAIDDRYETLQQTAPTALAPLLLAAVRGRVDLPPTTSNGDTQPVTTAAPTRAAEQTPDGIDTAAGARTVDRADTEAADEGDAAATTDTGAAGPRAEAGRQVNSRASGLLPSGSTSTTEAVGSGGSRDLAADADRVLDIAAAAAAGADPGRIASTDIPTGTTEVAAPAEPTPRAAATPVPVQPLGSVASATDSTTPTVATPQPEVTAAAGPAGAPPEPDAASRTVDLAALISKAAGWVGRGQYALAAHLLRPHLPAVASAAELAALAAAATGPSGPHEHELNARATAGEIEQLVDGDAARLLTTGATLLATAVTGSAALGNLLVDLSDRMDSAAAPLARSLGDTARAGHLAGRGLTALTRVAADEADVVNAAAQATERIRTHRASRLPRAAAVLSRLRSAGEDTAAAPQTLGDALHAAAGDRRQHVEAVNAIISRLSKPSALDRLIDDDDKAHRPPAGKAIEGTVRQEMLSTLREDLAAAARWAAAVQQHGPGSPDYVRGQLSALRETLLTRHEALTALLNGRASDPDPLVAAAATAAVRHVQRLVRLLSGDGGLAVPEPDPQETLDLPLLALPQAAWDPTAGIKLEPPLDSDLTALSTALLDAPDTGLDLKRAADQHIERDDFRSARHLLQRLSVPGRTAWLTALDDAQQRRVEQLRGQLTGVQQHLSRSRLADPDSATVTGSGITLDATTEDQLSRRLGRAISLLDEAEPDVRTAALTAADVQRELEALQENNRARLRTQLAELQATDAVAAEDLARVERRIGEGLLDLAADDLTRLAAGEALFDPVDDDLLGQFQPAIAALPRGLDGALLRAIRDGSRHPFLPDQPLPAGIRDDVHAGLNGWNTVRGAFESGWNRDVARDSLLPALRLVGLDARGAQVDQLDGKPFAYARGRRFLDINGAAVTGEALVPAFGSAAQGRYRLLLVWNNPTVEQLTEWRDSDGSHLPLIVCYFGTMPAADRLALAVGWSDPSRRPALVLDDAALAWIATRRGTFAMLMRLTLPFTATQPFRREKRADVPPEMFYGRARERRQLMNPNGPSVVYGGRGLGKSALLYTIERDADASVDDDLAVVWIEVDRISGIGDDPDLLWGELAEKLEGKGVTAGPRSSRSNPKDRVTKAVKSWTAQPGKRVLILLDEAEGFFNGDAPQFAHVRRLYQLSSETGFECKVVFSGLHSVQHYYAAGNIPFSPTGHLQIGPLTSQPAYQLLTRPLASLGYRVSEDDAQRVLLYCNYQPWLIQLVAERLLTTQLDRRAGNKTPLPPPWTINTADVVAALTDPTTRRDVRKAFGATLDIDKRTRVITSVLALHAYDNPPGARMPDAELYAECRTAWSSGFAGTTLVAFRELLNELAGLGILADVTDDSTGRAIRNETVLRALGSREDAERHLQEVALSALEVNEARGQERPARRDGVRRSPLTTAQLGQLFRKGNRARVIVGTTATGIEQVADSLVEVAPTMVTVELPGTSGAYRTLLESGATDAQRLLVAFDLTGMNGSEPCAKALTLAIGDDSGAGLPRNPAASRTVALLAGQSNADWLLELAARPDVEELVVPLERYDKYTLPLRWRGEGGLDVFADGALAQEALAVTDGWPQLVEDLAVEAARRKGRTARPAAALERLRAAQADPAWCRAFLTGSGALLPGWPDMARLLEVLVEYEEPCSPKDVQLLAADKVLDLPRTVRLAQWFGLVTLTDSVELLLSPLIAACWRTADVAAA
ncbi:hypothetical protein ACI8AK_05165 [Geodermatophilus sp. SYSU D00867]